MQTSSGILIHGKWAGRGGRERGGRLFIPPLPGINNAKLKIEKKKIKEGDEEGEEEEGGDTFLLSLLPGFLGGKCSEGPGMS